MTNGETHKILKIEGSRLGDVPLFGGTPRCVEINVQSDAGPLVVRVAINAVRPLIDELALFAEPRLTSAPG